MLRQNCNASLAVKCAGMGQTDLPKSCAVIHDLHACCGWNAHVLKPNGFLDELGQLPYNQACLSLGFRHISMTMHIAEDGQLHT